MKNFTKVLIFSLLGLFLLCNNASAVPIAGNDLQNLFDQNKDDQTNNWNNDINAQEDQMPMPKAWVLTETSDASHMVLYNESPDDIEFGIYSIAGNERAPVFTPGKTPVAKSTVSFDQSGALVVEYWNAGSLSLGAINYTFTGKSFGFYIANTDHTYYSDADLNDVNGDGSFGEEVDIALLVYKPDEASYVFAGDINGDRSFANIVTQAESMKPVPEPASLALLGLGLLGLAGIGRRKFAKK